MLRAEYCNQQEIISLFEPAYPSEKALKTVISSDEPRRRKRLRYAFGLPGYWLQPNLAQQLLTRINCLETFPLQLGRGFPMIMTSGIDSLLNMHYYQIGAEVIMPPLALALNDPETSLTRSGPNNFGKGNI